MNVKKYLQLLLWIVLLAGVAGAGWAANQIWSFQLQSTANGVASAPQMGDDKEGVVCIGYVDLEHGVRQLAPLHPGRVAKILVSENEAVPAGKPLLRLEDDEAKLQVEEAEAAHAAAEVQVAQAVQSAKRLGVQIEQQQAAVEAAGFRLDADRELLRHKEKQHKDNAIGAYEVAMTRNEVKALEASERAERKKLAELQLMDPALAQRQARAQLRLAKSRLEQARRQLEECVLKAPTAGTVQRILVGVGDLVTGQLGQPIVRFAPDEPPLIRAEVDQEFADRVHVGQAAMVRDDARSGTGWRGRVQRIAGWYDRRRANSSDPSAYTDVRAVECLIALDPGQAPLRLGQRMRVMIGVVSPRAGD